MPKTITDTDGNEEEVFTAQELEEQKKTIIDEKTKLEAELTGLKDKELNFAELRDSKKVAEGKKTKEEIEKEVRGKLQGEIDEKIGVAKKEVLDAVMHDHYSDQLKKLAGEDKELLDKVEFQYKRLSDPSTTKDEVSKKLGDAFVLATGGGKDPMNAAAFSSGGVGKLNIKKSGERLDAEAKQFGIELAKAGGITLKDEDFNK